MRLAIIPARGGSKRIPRKNVKHFAGKPMIAYAIEAATASGLFDHVVVTTDDADIAAFARSCGAETPFTRPPQLSDDHTPTVPVIAHAIEACDAIGWRAAWACCIYPCVPFIRVEDLRGAFDLLQTSGKGYSFPIASFASAVQRALVRREDGGMEPMFPEHELTRSQDLAPAFFDAGQFYWGRREAWLTEPRIHSSGAGYVIPEWRVVDIDTPEDWARAELIHAALSSR